MTKRLSKGKFKGWPSSNDAIHPLAAKKLRQLFMDEKSDLAARKKQASDLNAQK